MGCIKAQIDKIWGCIGDGGKGTCGTALEGKRATDVVVINVICKHSDIESIGERRQGSVGVGGR